MHVGTSHVSVFANTSYAFQSSEKPQGGKGRKGKWEEMRVDRAEKSCVHQSMGGRSLAVSSALLV